MWCRWILYYENRKCRKKLVDNLVEECTGTVEKVKPAKITLAEYKNKHKCSSCTLYIVLFSIIFTISIGIVTYFVYYKYMNRDGEDVSRDYYVYQATNYYYKREKSNKLTLKIELIIFTTTWSVLKLLIQAC